MLASDKGACGFGLWQGPESVCRGCVLCWSFWSRNNYYFRLVVVLLFPFF